MSRSIAPSAPELGINSVRLLSEERIKLVVDGAHAVITPPRPKDWSAWPSSAVELGRRTNAPKEPGMNSLETPSLALGQCRASVDAPTEVSK